jgi:predicted  nucleic acid-binding Zn-ribbon protein
MADNIDNVEPVVIQFPPEAPPEHQTVAPQSGVPFLFQRNQLALLWAGCTIAGGLAISLTKELSFARSLMPIAFLLGYAWYGMQFAGKNTQRFADSVYFLGFLWTLWALIDALIFRGDSITAAGMFKAFGYALITTASGMFVRLCIMQFQYTIPDQLSDARRGIEEDLSRLSTAFHRTIDGLTQFQMQTGESIATFEARMQTIYVKAAEENAERLRRSIAAVAESIDSIGEHIPGVATQLRSLATRLKNASGKLDENIDVIGRAFEELPARVNAIDIPKNIISAKLDAVVADLRREGQELANGIRDTNSIINQYVENITRNLLQLPKKDDFDRVFAEHLRILDTLNQQTTGLQEKVSQANTALAVIADQATQVRDRINQANATADGFVSSTHEAMKTVRKAGQDLDNTLTEVVDFIGRRLAERR